jgi:hypothetical protein
MLRKLRNYANAQRAISLHNEEAGIWSYMAEKEVSKRILFPLKSNKQVKGLQIIGFITFLLTIWLADLHQTVGRNEVVAKYVTDNRALFWVCTFPILIYLWQIVYMMSYFTNGAVSQIYLNSSRSNSEFSSGSFLFSTKLGC